MNIEDKLMITFFIICFMILLINKVRSCLQLEFHPFLVIIKILFFIGAIIKLLFVNKCNKV